MKQLRDMHFDKIIVDMRNIHVCAIQSDQQRFFFVSFSCRIVTLFKYTIVSAELNVLNFKFIVHIFIIKIVHCFMNEMKNALLYRICVSVYVLRLRKRNLLQIIAK